MKRLLPTLDVDIVVEHGGHKVAIQGSGRRFIAKFPTLFSLGHFALRLWPFRKLVPDSCEWQVEWRGYRFPRR
jgi:hypothetical protein